MTGTGYLDGVRDTYDTVAESYAQIVPGLPCESALELTMISAFADRVRGRGRVADLGCGPGRMTAVLAANGLDAFGVDLSPGMIAVARRDQPGLEFSVGSIDALDLPDRALAGILAWYSVIHTPPVRLRHVFEEFRRVLVPGGEVCLGWHVGSGKRHIDQAYGHEVSMDAWLYEPDDVAGPLESLGFEVTARLVVAPQPPFRFPQGSLLARRPG